MRFGRASMTVTGIVSPVSLKTRVMPAFRPTRPTVLVALIVSPLFPRTPGCDWPRSYLIEILLPGSNLPPCQRISVESGAAPGTCEGWRIVNGSDGEADRTPLVAV